MVKSSLQYLIMNLLQILYGLKRLLKRVYIIVSIWLIPYSEVVGKSVDLISNNSTYLLLVVSFESFRNYDFYLGVALKVDICTEDQVTCIFILLMNPDYNICIELHYFHMSWMEVWQATHFASILISTCHG